MKARPKDGAEYLVDPKTGCWVWQRARISTGYAEGWANGRPVLMHRVFYERHVGPISEGLHLDHLCRNRACVNPEHLEPVTAAENNRRAAKLTWAKVHEIRAMPHRCQRDLARRFGVSRRTINDVLNNQSWIEGT